MNGWTEWAVAGWLVAGWLAAGCAPAGAPAATPSAGEIVARNAAARGGLEAWRKVETMVWLGRIESAHAPMPSMHFELEQKRPNKTRLQIIALGDRTLRAFDGVHGWKLRPAHGRPELEPYSPPELKFAAAGHGIDGPLIDGAARGDSVTLQGVDEIDGRRAYHLIVRPAKGGNEDVWVDAETYLEVRYDRMTEGVGDGQRRVSQTFGDYRTVDGLRIPFLIATGGGPGSTPDRMQIETVLLNPQLDDSMFGNPVAPHRARAWAGVTPRAPTPALPATASSGAAAAGGGSATP